MQVARGGWEELGGVKILLGGRIFSGREDQFPFPRILSHPPPPLALLDGIRCSSVHECKTLLLNTDQNNKEC